ncbi:MAG: hypothetical protein C0467_24705 [Planctomycetaceae bacterium]|nr:hypothetical protein [Planctomycetaceae bacterium]
MSITSLFPDDPEPLKVAERAEPTVWIRRLVVVSNRTPDATVLRAVEFRTGLNIIRVAERPQDDTRSIGHSVGKTLLARFIRYCLGETYFATAETARAIVRKLPTAHVLAEIRVTDKWWVVARPLRDGGESWAMIADNWRAGLATESERLRYPEFVDAVTTAVVSALPAFQLPSAGHAPRWVDLLGWLARDYECHYQQPNQWRVAEARSGTAQLEQNDPGLLMSWALGVLDTTEIREQAARKALQKDQAKAKREIERLDNELDALRPGLARSLGLDEAKLAGGMYESVGKAMIESRRTNLTNLLKDFETGGSKGLREESIRTAAAVRVEERDIERLQGIRDTTRDQIRLLEDAGRLPPVNPFDVHSRCPRETECPFHPSQVTPISDPTREIRLAAKREELAALDEQLAERNRQLAEFRRQAADAETQEFTERRIQEDRARGTNIALGQVEQIATQFGEYTTAQKQRDAEQEKLNTLVTKIDESLKTQRAAKGVHAMRQLRVSDCFDRAVRALLGSEVGGKVVLDARGLHPEPHGRIAVGGAAIRSLGTVLAFDLGCLAATIIGVGSLPGFWLHDSPRDADIEPVLYDRLFQFAHELEQAYGDRQPAFQYIVTTTTPPPAELGQWPFARLTLDARDDAGLLLGVRW